MTDHYNVLDFINMIDDTQFLSVNTSFNLFQISNIFIINFHNVY